MQQSNLFLAYFVDGLSTRRGSVMAALGQGLPVVSTLGPYTESEFMNQPFIHLLPIENEAFATGFLELLKKGPESYSADEIRKFQMENFSWDKIVKDYMDFSNSLGIPKLSSARDLR
jgi:glycosyltransferase involved in cell wall biosynthesis